MYSDKLVVAIKSNGKILREATDLVTLPFGSEFSVLVKNLNSRRAKFTLHIDGTDVLDGTEIIVNANSEVEMKRFIRNGNMDEGNAFKFIERTQTIEDGPRGIKVDDGVVRVQFWFEKEVPVVNTVYTRDVWWNDRHYYTKGGLYGQTDGTFADSSPSYKTTKSSAMRGMSIGASASVSNLQNAALSSSASFSPQTASGGATMDSYSPEVNEAGITVPGSKVEQKFTAVYGFNAETQSHVIVLRMTGRVGSTEVVAPVTVKTQPKCTTCGKVNKAQNKFCSDCGTALTLF